MSPIRLAALSLTSLLAVIPACATDSGTGDAGDAEDGVNDVATGKADSPSEVDAVQILSLVNDVRQTSFEFDEQIGLSQRVADAIIAHRDGEDGEAGTEDDDAFDTLEELDAIPYIGPVTMRTLLTYARAHAVDTKLRIDLAAPPAWGEAPQPLSALDAQLEGSGIAFADRLELGARDGVAFLRVLKAIEQANAMLGTEYDLDQTWDPSQYVGLCYEGSAAEVPAVVENLRYSLFSIYMGVQAERWGTEKHWYYSGAGGEDEREWIDAQRDDNDHGAEVSVWQQFDTASQDFLMMTDGGQQGDGTELFAVTIPPCE